MTSKTAGAPSRPLEEQARRVAARSGHHKRGVHRLGREDWAGQTAAIYCRISHAKDEDQTGVDRQERICRDVANRLGLTVHDRYIYVDNNRSAWQRKRKRPGWDSLLKAAERGEVTHIICYHPDRLMRQPHDLETLLSIADENDITLHGQANRRDLSDPDDRFFLRIEVAHACRSSDDASRRLTDALLDKASEGRPHTGYRRYGYTADGESIVDEEAKVIEWVFHAYVVNGTVPGQIAAKLKAGGIKTSTGKEWTEQGVRQLLDSPYVAGLRVYRGEVIGRGTWPAIISEGLFQEAQKRRRQRTTAWKKEQEGHVKRFYVLKGIVVCKRCAVHMSGSKGNGPQYICSRHQRNDELKCKRSVGAVNLEKFVIDAALELLESLDPEGQVSQAASTPADEEAIEVARQELAEAKDMWESGESTLKEYRAMKKTIEARIADLQPKSIDRPTAEVLAGITGPNARPEWRTLQQAEDYPRMNAILTYLFREVIIDERSIPGTRFDFSRISIKQNPL